METNEKKEYGEEVPDVVKNEPDDEPAGRGVIWAIAITIIILAIIYFVFFNDAKDM